MDMYDEISDFLRSTDYDARSLVFEAAKECYENTDELYGHLGGVTVNCNALSLSKEDVLSVQEGDVQLWYNGAWHDFVDLDTRELFEVLDLMIS